ncbi:MAG: VOC family protein [Chloroflexota bacterium]|nr:VOC family protein [Chloroflexota bacterium]
MGKIVPELAVSDMEQSLQFYTTLGFVKDNEGIVDEQGAQWYSLALGEASLWLIRSDVAHGLVEGDPRGNGVTIYVEVDDIDTLHERVSDAGLLMNIVKPIETMWYGLRQFSMADPDGYILTLNQQVAQPDGAAGEGQAEEGTQGEAGGE